MILIKDMKMPNSCSECRLKDSERGECYVAWKKVSSWRAKYAETRPRWCPLTEVDEFGVTGLLYKETYKEK